MRNYEDMPQHPWDDGVYGTGRTQPPKSHGGLICLLLILVISLSGVVTVLGIMNIRLTTRLNEEQERNSEIAFAAEQPEVPAFQPEETMPMESATEPDIRLDIQHLPTEETTHPEQEPEVPTPLPLQTIYENSIPSVVSITSSLRNENATGTGVILAKAGYVVTNYHVIENALSISVRLHDDREFTASIVGSDPASDLAVLHIQADGLTPAQFGSSDELRVGDSVVAIGDPLGVEYRGTMTNGIVSAINRDVNVNGRPMNLIQTNAALNAGNSGGPLINCYGQVIGINTMKIDDLYRSGVEGLGFAIPSATVKDIVDQIISQGYVSGRPSLGIRGEGLSLFYQRYYRLPAGLYITEVLSGSAAEEAGIQPGDMLLSLDGTRIYSYEELVTLLYNYSAGDEVTLILYRSGSQYELTVTLQEAKG